MRSTERLKLILPNSEDYFDVQDLNQNFDKLDDYPIRIGAGATYLELGNDGRKYLAYKSKDNENKTGFIDSEDVTTVSPEDGASRLMMLTNYSTLGTMVDRLGLNYSPFVWEMGTVQVPGGGGSNSSATQTFTRNLFKNSPQVFICPSSTVPQTVEMYTTNAVSVSGFTIVMRRTTTTQTGFFYLAIARRRP